MAVIFLTALIVSLTFFFKWLTDKWSFYKFAVNGPGLPFSLPFLGHSYLFFGYGQESLFARMCSLFNDIIAKQPFFKFWLGPKFSLVVTEPDYAKQIIFSQQLLDKDDVLVAADPMVGQGMLFGSGPKVRKHRKHFMPSFNKKILEKYVEVFQEHSTELLKALKIYQQGETINIEHYFHYCAFDGVNETIIGVKTNCQNEPTYRELCKRLIDIYGLTFQDIIKPWLFYGRIFLNLIGVQTQVDITRDIMDRHMFKALHQKKAELQGSKITSKNEIHNGYGTHDESSRISTLEYILTTTDDIDDEDIVVELKNIFMASSDTVAQISAFLAKMFAIHPEYQEAAYRECKEVLEDSDTLTIPLLNRLVYLEKCIKETLRLFPIAPFLVRKTTHDVKFGDRQVPLNSTLLIGVYWLHRHPKQWSYPDRFYPEHFSQQNVEARSPGAYLPFSGGAHSCIGKTYAMLFMKTILSRMLLQYRFGPTSDDLVDGQIPDGYVSKMKLGTDISIRLVGGIKVKLFRREK